MPSTTTWNELSTEQLVERAYSAHDKHSCDKGQDPKPGATSSGNGYSIADALQKRDEEEAADLLRHLAWRFKGSEEWIESLKSKRPD